MTGRKTKAQRPRVRRSDATTRPARQAKKRGSGGEKHAAAPAAKKVETEPTSRKSAARVQAAAPLLSHTAKKIGALDKPSSAKTPQADASYQPKTQAPATPVPHNATAAAARPVIDVMAMAQPWMTLGWQMTAASLALQARMAKAALDMPPAATAMRQGAEALNAWFRLMEMRPQRKD